MSLVCSSLTAKTTCKKHTKLLKGNQILSEAAASHSHRRACPDTWTPQQPSRAQVKMWLCICLFTYFSSSLMVPWTDIVVKDRAWFESLFSRLVCLLTSLKQHSISLKITAQQIHQGRERQSSETMPARQVLPFFMRVCVSCALMPLEGFGSSTGRSLSFGEFAFNASNATYANAQHRLQSNADAWGFQGM